MKIIYLDETMFTKQTYATHSYGSRRHIVEVNEADVCMGYVWAIAAILSEKGIEHITTSNQATDGETFNIFMDELSKK